MISNTQPVKAAQDRTNEEYGGWRTPQPGETIEEFTSAARPSAVDGFKYAWVGIDAPDSATQRTESTGKTGTCLAPCAQCDCGKDQTNFDFRDDAAQMVKMGRDIIARYETDVLGKQKTVKQAQKDAVMRELWHLAVRSRCVCGKWMVFANKDNVDVVWAKIAKATYEGRLGHCAKVSTPDPTADPPKDTHVICVYCPDFTDREYCRRVLQELRNLGISTNASFKLDLLTYLGLYSEDLKRLRLDKAVRLHKDILDEVYERTGGGQKKPKAEVAAEGEKDMAGEKRDGGEPAAAAAAPAPKRARKFAFGFADMPDDDDQ